MPKKTVAYTCNLCGAVYSTEKEANDCENMHLTPFDYTPKWKKGYEFPESVIVEFDRDIRYEYVRSCRLK